MKVATTRKRQVDEQRVDTILEDDRRMVDLLAEEEYLAVARQSGDISEEEYDARRLTLGAQIAEKADATYRYAAMCSNEANRHKGEAKAHNAIAERWAKREERLRDYLKWLLIRIGQDSLGGGAHRISLVPVADPKTPEIYDESLIPREYKNEVVTYPVDVPRVMQALLSQIEVPGARLKQAKGTTVRMD